MEHDVVWGLFKSNLGEVQSFSLRFNHIDKDLRLKRDFGKD